MEDGSPDASLAAELEATTDASARRFDQLELQSLFSGEYDDRDAVAEVHAGAGGTDAQDWTEMLLRMYQRWAERRGFTVEVDEATPGQEAGLLSATFIVHGRFAYGLLAAERGVHRLVRMSPFDAQRRRQTSFASLDVVPFLTRSPTRSTSTRRTYASTPIAPRGPAASTSTRPTRPSASRTCRPEWSSPSRTSGANIRTRPRPCRSSAAKLAERARAERRAELDSLSGDRSDNALGSQIRSYVLAPYQLVKDLRTGVETGNVEAVLDGDLDAFMEAELRRQRGSGAGSPS